MRRVIPYLLLAAGVAACYDDVPTIPPDGPLLAEVGSRPVYQVSGGGSVVREDPSGTRRSVYAFHATLDATGTVSGEAEVHFTSNPAHLHIDVQCLVVRGNEAWLSGPVTRTDNPHYYLGGVFLWRVQDNGQGRSAEPDRISSFVWRPEQNYPPGACVWQPEPESWVMDPWTNGNVQIRGDNEDFSLADMSGTWDAILSRYIWLEDPRDTFDMLATGVAVRMTVAPDGAFSMVWWVPGEIIENIHGTMEVANGEARVTAPEAPGVVVVARLWRVGSAVWMESDQLGHDFDGDDEEDWSHVIGLSQPKTTGTRINDLAGVWDAIVWRYTSTDDPTVTWDVLADGEHSITVTVSLDSRLSFVVEPEGWTSTTDELLIDGNQMLTRNGHSQSFVFTLEGDRWSLSGLDAVDFDQDGTQDPAILEAVVVRR
jgi:hypothetical protein